MKNDKIKVIYSVDNNEYYEETLDRIKECLKFPKKVIPTYVTVYKNYSYLIDQSLTNNIDLQQLFIIAHAFEEDEDFIFISNDMVLDEVMTLDEIRENKDFSKPLLFNVEKLLLFFEKYCNDINLEEYFC